MVEEAAIGQVTFESFVLFLLVIFGVFVVGNAIFLVVRAILKNRIPPNMSKTIARVLNYLFYAIGLYFAFTRVLGLNLTTLAAALGIAGIITAISAQQILQNLVAGIIIALERPIRIGDWVEVGGSPQPGLCRVKDITLRRTVLRGINGQIIIVSNSTLITANIINYSRGEFSQVPVTVSIPIDSDVEKVKKIILDECKKHEKILPNIPQQQRTTLLRVIKIPYLRKFLERPKEVKVFEPSVFVKEISDGKIVLEVHIWTWEIQKKEEIVSDLLNKILIAFKENRIKLS